MIVPAKYILHSPISDRTQLAPFVEQCLREKISLLAIVGPGCAELEDLVDDILVGDGSDEKHFFCTTSHPEETIEDVISFAQTWDANSPGEVQQFRF